MENIWIEIIRTLVAPLIVAVVLLFVGRFINNLKEEFAHSRQLQAEHFAHEKRIKIYEALAEKVVKTKNAIYLSALTFQSTIGVIVSYYESCEKGEQDRDFSFITQVAKKKEETHKQLSDSVEDLINTFKAYSLALGSSVKLAQNIESKLAEVRALYLNNFANILTLKCGVEGRVQLKGCKNDILYLLNNISPQYKSICDEITELVSVFGDQAQAALLGPLFQHDSSKTF